MQIYVACMRDRWGREVCVSSPNLVAIVFNHQFLSLN